jgi:hypothetical protein
MEQAIALPEAGLTADMLGDVVSEMLAAPKPQLRAIDLNGAADGRNRSQRGLISRLRIVAACASFSRLL